MATGRRHARSKQTAFGLLAVAAAVAVSITVVLVAHAHRDAVASYRNVPAPSAGAGCDGLDMSGCSWNLPTSPGAAASRSPGCTGTCAAPAVPCDTACQQAALVRRNENQVLPRPKETPAITQQQLDQQRQSAEASYPPAQASNGPNTTPSPNPAPAPTPGS